MDFFNAQRQAYASTKRLILLFAGAVATLIIGMHLLVSLVMVWQRLGNTLWDGEVFLLTAFATILVVGVGMVYKIQQLRHGGPAVCQAMGAVQVPLTPPDSETRRLRNLVEEMSLAAGVPVPSLFVMERETGINAFAAGFTPSDAAICVTRGCLAQLSRDELQGVIAHEFSHILNGDMRLNIRLMGVLHGILYLSLAGYALMRHGPVTSGSRRGSGFAVMGFGLGLVIIGSVGALFSRLIQAAVSRQREFLADASAVQFTRNPKGISGALSKIGGLEVQSRIDNPRARAVSHMFFAKSVFGRLSGWLSTHPPIVDRIQAIDPHLARRIRRTETTDSTSAAAVDTDGIPIAGFAGGASAVSAADSVASIGHITPEQVECSRKMLDALPLDVSVAVHDPFSARALIYCLLLDKNSGIRRTQLKSLQGSADPNTLRETINLSSSVRKLDRHLRLPLIDLALPALRMMSLQQAKTFRKNIKSLVDADERVSLFEFTVETILNRHLDSAFLGARELRVKYHTIDQLADECCCVLSILAHAGHDDREAIASAFADGAWKLAIGDLEMFPFTECTCPQVIEALDRLVLATPDVKRTALTAFAHAVASDGEIRAVEAELLRAVADAMECPMPPIPLTEGAEVAAALADA